MKRILDLKVWRNGNASVVTIPSETMKALKIRNGDRLEVTIVKRTKNEIEFLDKMNSRAKL